MPVSPAVVTRAFGRRVPDGLTLSAAIVVWAPPDRQVLDGARPEGRTLRVLGEDVALRRDGVGRILLPLHPGDGQPLAIAAFGVSDAELVAAAESFAKGSAAAVTPALPVGFQSVHSTEEPTRPFPFTDQRWEAADGEAFQITVAQVQSPSLDAVTWEFPGARAQPVKDTTGLIWEGETSVLTWIETTTPWSASWATASTRAAFGPLPSLRPLDEEGWRKLAASAQHPSPVPRGTVTPVPVEPNAGGSSFFMLQPVLRSTAPPCPSEGTTRVVPEVHRDEATVCHELGPPGVTAEEVVTAVASQGQGGDWQVEFTLSPEGASRFSELAGHAGVGGQIAIVVDGRVVAAPRVAEPSDFRHGVINRLDQEFARRLAERLGT